MWIRVVGAAAVLGWVGLGEELGVARGRRAHGKLYDFVEACSGFGVVLVVVHTRVE